MNDFKFVKPKDWTLHNGSLKPNLFYMDNLHLVEEGNIKLSELIINVIKPNKNLPTESISISSKCFNHAADLNINDYDYPPLPCNMSVRNSVPSSERVYANSIHSCKPVSVSDVHGSKFVTTSKVHSCKPICAKSVHTNKPVTTSNVRSCKPVCANYVRKSKPVTTSNVRKSKLITVSHFPSSKRICASNLYTYVDRIKLLVLKAGGHSSQGKDRIGGGNFFKILFLETNLIRPTIFKQRHCGLLFQVFYKKNSNLC